MNLWLLKTDSLKAMPQVQDMLGLLSTGLGYAGFTGPQDYWILLWILLILLKTVFSLATLMFWIGKVYWILQHNVQGLLDHVQDMQGLLDPDRTCWVYWINVQDMLVSITAESSKTISA